MLNVRHISCFLLAALLFSSMTLKGPMNIEHEHEHEHFKEMNIEVGLLNVIILHQSGFLRHANLTDLTEIKYNF